jgi:hypothetical protein
MEDLMARKRTPKQAKTEPNQSTPDAADSTQAATMEEASPTGDAPEDAPSMVNDPLPDEASFAKRVQQEERSGRIPDPFGIAGDNEAGVHLYENRQERLMAIKFDEKPSEDVRNCLKEAGYRWNPRDEVWVHPVRPGTALATRIEADRLYNHVCEMVRQDKGLASSPEIPF